MRSTLPEARRTSSEHPPYLLVLGREVFATYELPDEGNLVIGRRPTADVWINDPLLSFDHAVLSVGPGGYTIEDLASLNGTWLRQGRLAPRERVALALGESVTLGSCLLIVHPASTSPRPRRALSYGFFRIRLDEEIARAEYEPARRFSVGRVQILSRTTAQPVEQAASRIFRPFDTFAAFAPDEYAILFAGTSAEDARTLLADFTSTLTVNHIKTRSTVARYPDHGRTPAELETHCLRTLRPQLAELERRTDIVADSSKMKSLCQQAERIATSRLCVLLTGETGAGKDVLARFIHERSPRASRPFQAINCAALPDALLEGQLFGHERGAFTGADRSQRGLVEAAEGGTVFLDEVGEIPLALQSKLLRLLESGEIQVLGASQPRRVDVRFLAATNRDLARAVVEKRFRADLLYRLKGVCLRVPPLRERREDILPLAWALLDRFATLEGLEGVIALSAGAQVRLAEYSWPGNVRELANVLHRAVVLCGGQTVGEDDLFLDERGHPSALDPDDDGTDADWDDNESRQAEVNPRQRAANTVQDGVPSMGHSGPHAQPAPRAAIPTAADGVKPSRRVVNPSYGQVRDALAHCGGNQSRAALLLGVPRKRLRDLINFFQLPQPRQSRP